MKPEQKSHTTVIASDLFPTSLESFFAALSLLAVLFVSLDRYMQWPIPARPFLLFASTAFVAIPLCTKAIRSVYGGGIFIALVFCWLGDFFGPYQFMMGVGFFLIGHWFLIAAYWFYGLAVQRIKIVVPFSIGLSSIIAYYLLPHVSIQERWLVIAYLFTITLMIIFAWSTRGKRLHWLVSIGALLFYISDLFLALKRYTSIEVDFTYFGYPMYYTACVLFGLSVSTAQNKIKSNKIITLSAQDQKILLSAMQNPPEPNCHLKKAADLYKK